MENFYDRTQILIGKDALKKLQETHITVLGVGGVGSWVCESLVRMGIGFIKIIDFDKIDVTNINRQIHALDSTIGMSKVSVMRDRLLQINPAVHICTYEEKVEKIIYDDLFNETDYTIDCIDDVRAKVDVIKWHIEENKKIISCMGTGNKIGIKPFQIKDISKTSVCPLARAIRIRLRKEGIYHGVPVLFSEELPNRAFAKENSPTGTISYMPAMAGLELSKYVALEILKEFMK